MKGLRIRRLTAASRKVGVRDPRRACGICGAPQPNHKRRCPYNGNRIEEELGVIR
jgi:hypothetical protein